MPFHIGKYEVVPGLRVLGADFKNSQADKKTFQIDRSFFLYRNEKLKSRSEGVEKYYPKSVRMPTSTFAPIIEFITDSLCREYPHLFKKESGRGIRLNCSLTDEILAFRADFTLDESRSRTQVPYRDAFDALAMQVQEDLAVWRTEGADEWLGAVHLSFPNHWDPQQKIGKGFMEVHAPVADFEKLRKVAPNLVEGMIQRGPFVRFAWGVATDDHLNHHPEKPGRVFHLEEPKLYVRVERQTLNPFAAVGAGLFTVRTYFENCADWKGVNPLKAALIQAIEGMSQEALVYKGLSNCKAEVVSWLKSY